MKKATFFSISTLILALNPLFGQFIVKDTYFEATGVSNQGWVAGYEAQAGPYSIWKPDAGTTVEIGGLAPGQGVGGQAQFSGDGNFLSGTSAGPIGAEMSRYDYATGQWTLLGNLGFTIDNTVSAGWAISGDGKTVTGNSWADTTGGFAYTHAVAWVEGEGLVDLGSLFADMGRSTRANAVSHDGSVVVGWQDFNGPWKSAVWRKNPAGGYFSNKYLLVDPNGDPNDEFNQLGECSAVSADGKWIGGYGDYANNDEPWIWSEATGVVNLGTLAVGGRGFVSGINADGSVVVGWFNAGFFEPQIPFIWTPSGGIQDLNVYISTIGLSTGTKQVYTANCMSKNGQYIAGYGVDTASFAYFTYRLSLPTSAAHEVTENSKIQVYPNPSTHFVAVENTENAVLTINSMDGKIMYSEKIVGNQVVDVSKYPSGVYLLVLKSGRGVKTCKLVKAQQR